MTDGQLIIGAMKAAAWERAKGALRELVALRGAVQSDVRETVLPFEETEAAVDAFIREIEDNALHE